jgi:tetratricopeptide (TPR) repeat protein
MWARLAWGLVAVLTLSVAFLTGGPQGTVALTAQTVVADLGAGQALSPALRAAVQAHRAAPGDAAQALHTARLMIDEGRARGDSRLVGASLPVLQPILDRGMPAAQFLAATARQYQHDFPGALVLLDLVIAADPRDVNALLNRATIHTVLGDFPTARQDCRRIGALRGDVGYLCVAGTMTLTRDAPDVAVRLSAMLADPAAMDPGLRPWAQSLLGEIALMQGDAVTAERHLQQVLTRDPGAQRDQLMLADILLQQRRANKVLALLHPAPDTDGVLIRRVLALRSLGRDDAGAVATLATRAQRSLDIGLAAHAREEAMFHLQIARDPARALERSLANWDRQHEFDDARLLILAADAAGQPAAALPVLDWMQTAGIDAPALVLPASILNLRPAVKP